MPRCLNNNETITLSFTGLSSETSKGKKILRDISGHFNGGSLIAIMGSSGAGKTTLLNILSGYSYQNAKCDTISINGAVVTFEYLSKISCYLTQDIHLNDLLNVKENMHYGADFKLGLSHSQEEKLEIIKGLLDSFGLSETLHTRAGKLSGGERKRLALALEMISDPNIIFLDEPTTGLDISTTHQILSYLKKLANSGKTVICTIHQVSANHLELFDHLYVVTDGYCAYQGKPRDLVQFLDDQGLPCSIYYSPIEYLIELCSGDYGHDKRLQLINASQNGNWSTHLIENGYMKVPEKEMLIGTNVTWWYQAKTLFSREAKKLSRNIVLLPLKFFGPNLVAFCVGLLFWDFGNDASKILYNYQLLLAIVANVLITGFLYPILSYPLETPLIKRECYNRYYTIFQYYLATFLLDLPITAITVSCSSMLTWYMTSQPMEIKRIMIFQLFILSFGCVVNAVGYFFGTLNLPIGTSLILCVCTQLPLKIVSGFGFFYSDMPSYIEVLSWGSYARSGVQGTVVAALGLEHRKMICPEEAEYCYNKEPHKFLISIGIDPDHYIYWWVNLVVWFFAFKFATYFMMKRRLGS